MAEQTIKEMLKMIDAKIEHIEDITADNRAVIIKLVKQSNQIVRFLSNLEIEDITDGFEDITSPPLSESEKLRSDKMQELKELVNEFMDKQQDLKEFEEELKKNKDKLTPGQIGES
jgi:methyl-accepting chemotaxis protein